MRTKLLLTILFTALALFMVAACTANQNQTTGSITGGVYNDCNNDGECDCDDKGIADITVRLYEGACGEFMIRSQQSDLQGEFAFRELSPGEYCVMTDVLPTCGGYAGNAPTTSISRKITLEPGQDIDLLWFGYGVEQEQ